MRILVVTSTYNTPADWLERCLDSVAAQDTEHTHVVIDDGSTDRATLKVLASHEQTIYRPKNGGPGSGILNDAIAVYPGEYIAVLDHDDIMSPGRLRLHRDYLTANPHVACVSGYADLIGHGGERIGKTWRKGGPYEAKKPPKDTRKWSWSTYRCPNHATVMYRREWFDRVGGYPLKGNWNGAAPCFPADSLFFDSMADAGALFTILPVVGCQKRIHAGSAWFDKRKARLIEGVAA